jgi:hypothetical protein
VWEATASVPLARDALTVLVAVLAVALGRRYLRGDAVVTDAAPGVERDWVAPARDARRARGDEDDREPRGYGGRGDANLLATGLPQ